MSAGDTPHDSLFRALLSDAGRAEAFLRQHLPPPIVARLGPDPPVPLPGTYVDEALRNSQSDCLFQVTLKDGRTGFVYVLLEHKSTPDLRTPLQLLTYMLRIWSEYGGQDLRRLPPIIPVVVYHGTQTWTVPRSVVEALDAEAPLRRQLRDLRYTLVDLGKVADRQLAAHPETRSGLMALKYAARPERLERLADILRGVEAGSLLEEKLMYYIASVFEGLTPDRLRAAARQAKPEQEERMVSLAAEQWMKEGEARGVALGKLQTIRMGLEARFGPLPPEIEARLREVPSERLDTLARRMMTAASLQDVFGDAP